MIDNKNKKCHLLKVGDFILNTESQKLFDLDKKEVPISTMLFRLLCFFCENSNVLLTSDEILENVWAGRVVGKSNLNQHVAKLRALLNGDAAFSPNYIKTENGCFRLIANIEDYFLIQKKKTKAD